MRKFSCFIFSVLLFMFAFFILTSSEATAEQKKIGIVMWNKKSSAYLKPLARIKSDLQKKGYTEQQIEVFYPPKLAKAEKKQYIKDLFTKLNKSDDYSVIVASGTNCTKIGASVVKEKPLVFFSVTDPVASKLVNSWESSGNNLAGVSIKVPIKTVMYTFTQVAPEAKTIGVIHKKGDFSGLPYIDEIKKLAQNLSIKFVVEEVNDHTQLKQKTQEMLSTVDGFFLHGETIISTYGKDIVDIATQNNKPTLGLKKYIVKDWGCTLGNVVDFDMVGVKAASIIDRVYKGADPSNLKVVLLKEFPLLINLKNIKQIGLDLPYEAIDLADEVIE